VGVFNFRGCKCGN